MPEGYHPLRKLPLPDGEPDRRQRGQPIVLTLGPAECDVHILPLDVAGFGQILTEYRYPLCARHRRTRIEITNHRHRRLLRARRERPRAHRATEQRDELAADHSITSSARASTVAGMSRPSALAVLRLMTSSYFVGACTGRSAGFSPFKMRST